RTPGNIVERGSHVAEGDVVLARGTPVSPAVLGALASAGFAHPAVAARPRVALIGTGSELVPVDHAPGPGAIRNSNNAALLGQCLRAGAEPVDLGIARDEEDVLRAAIRRGLEHDVLVLSGGVSRGDLDLVPGALEAEGVTCLFHRWSVQPGGPIWLGVKDATPVFGLPGNPAGTFVGFEVLAVPALRGLLGMGIDSRRTLRARYEGPWGKSGPRRRYRPARLETTVDGVLLAKSASWKGSGDPFGLATGDALVVLPEEAPAPEDGPAVVDVIPLHEADMLWGGR
nr:molybdopterin molybdotransferase MoeA [Planctomycetota bacterium]